MVNRVLNPVRYILQSRSPLGVKIIALSLLLVMLSALPIILHSIFGNIDTNPLLLSWLFGIGAMLAHIGFLVGILLLLKDFYFGKK